MQRLASDENLQELQRFAELGRLSASLLHEISNPLTSALLNLELGEEQSYNIRRARHSIQTLRRYVEAARQQVKRQSNAITFCAHPQIDQLKRIVMPLAKRSGVRLDIGPVLHRRLCGDPVKFQHILVNLIVNAVEAYNGEPEKSRSRVSQVSVSLADTNKWLVIQITDWGVGIKPKDLPRIFETFFTTKDRAGGHGLGLGLAMVRQYVEQDFGGSIRVASSLRKGTRFVVKLPAQKT